MSSLDDVVEVNVLFQLIDYVSAEEFKRVGYGNWFTVDSNGCPYCLLPS